MRWWVELGAELVGRDRVLGCFEFVFCVRVRLVCVGVDCWFELGWFEVFLYWYVWCDCVRQVDVLSVFELLLVGLL